MKGYVLLGAPVRARDVILGALLVPGVAASCLGLIFLALRVRGVLHV